jgi:hypothetical protein
MERSGIRNVLYQGVGTNLARKYQLTSVKEWKQVAISLEAQGTGS